MQTQSTWIYNRYQAGNIFDVFAYADVTKDLEGVKLPQKGVQNWNSAKMKQLSANAQKHAAAFRWENIANKQRALYTSLLQV